MALVSAGGVPAKKNSSSPERGQIKQLYAPYKWKGKNKKGRIVHGQIQAKSVELATIELKKQGVTVIYCKPAPKDLLSPSVNAMDIAMLSRQICTMLGAGVPIIQTLELLAGSANKNQMRNLLGTISAEVASGIPLSKSLRRFPKYFDALYCDLVAAGEQSGALEKIYDRIATMKEKAELLKSKIKKALIYPSAIIVVAVVVTAILLIFVVPQFEDLFHSFGAELPAFTQFVVNLSKWMQSWWFVIALIITVVTVVFLHFYRSKPAVHDAVDKFMLHIPVIGEILSKASIARISSTLSTTFAAGIPLVDALVSAAGASGNALYRDAIMDVRNEVIGGMQMNVAMRTTMVFPDMLVQMVMIGEQAGSLDDMLNKLANIYQAQVDDAVDGLSSLLEPMIMVILGVLIGGLVIAMYLPIFTMGSVIK